MTFVVSLFLVKRKILSLVGLVVFTLAAVFQTKNQPTENSTGAPPYTIEDLEPPDLDPYLLNWQRPAGPAKVALQAGHWKNAELPNELARLRGNTGATGGGHAEWEVNLAVAQKTADLLRKEGVVVDILPSTIPTNYWADVFVAIHADGNPDRRISGFKVSPPYRDLGTHAKDLAQSIEKSYQEATKLEIDPNVTRNMRGYYAFAWWRYDHAVHPKSTAVILETGFLTCPADRELLVNSPDIPAKGLAAGILTFLRSQNLPNL